MSESRPPAPALPGQLPAEIFKAYDIRGIVGKTLTPAITEQIGRAIGSEALARGTRQVAVARDGRLSGPDLAQALAHGLVATGCDVVDVGRVPTPVLYFTTHHLGTHSGVMVTGSHNPPEYNGLKIVLGGETLSGAAIQDLRRRLVEGDLSSGHGTLRQSDVREAYLQRITSDVRLERRLRIIIDCG
ncbi:MAG: phosphohexomutase domain-containing protein, partial [Acidiferrobacterales bacterium]